MNVTTRPATQEDREWARAIHHAAYRDVVLRQFSRWDEATQDAFFENDWDGRDNQIIVVDHELCGYCCIESRDQDVHVRELVVSTDHQGKGIGTSLLRDALETARERKVPVVLGTLHENRARFLYERLGFIEFDRTDTHLLMRSGVHR